MNGGGSKRVLQTDPKLSVTDFSKYQCVPGHEPPPMEALTGFKAGRPADRKDASQDESWKQ